MRRLTSILLVSTLAACTEARELTLQANCPDFPSEVLDTLRVECSSCHGQVVAEGGYRLDSYVAAFEPDASGARRVVPGDPSSLLLTRASDDNDYHTPKSDLTVPLLTRWVVDCRANYLPNELVHPLGWATPGSSSSHAAVLRGSGWPLDDCKACHGEGTDPAGGPVERSCVACHADGPTGCDACHGDTTSAAPPPSLDDSTAVSDPGVGAHRAHIRGGSVLGRSVACNECHIVPADWRDPGHIFGADGNNASDGRAEVVFGATASITLPGRDGWRSGAPAYDAETATCTGVYCHGGALPDDRTPVWTAERGESCANDSECEGGYACFADACAPDCTFCHDLPPGGGTHRTGLVAADCATCHSSVVDANLAFVDASKHLDGIVEIGDGSGSCSECHGGTANAAPPVGLAGETSTDDPAVGAHQVHLGVMKFAAPFSCDACHIEPQGATFFEAASAAGHMDSPPPAEVFPGAGAFPGLAAPPEKGAAPVYDESTATCSGVYCHGGGTRLRADTAPTIVRSPSWTDVGNGTIVCGSCHGLPPIPPSDPNDPDYWFHPSPAISDPCNTCHAATVDADGAIVFENGTTRHVNGEIDQNR